MSLLFGWSHLLLASIPVPGQTTPAASLPPEGFAAYRECVIGSFSLRGQQEDAAVDRVNAAIAGCEQLRLAMEEGEREATKAADTKFRRDANLSPVNASPSIERAVATRVNAAAQDVRHEALEKLLGELPPYDFNGVLLDTTMEEFKNLPHPDGLPGAHVVCSRPSEGEERPATMPDARRAAEVIREILGREPYSCAWYANKRAQSTKLPLLIGPLGSTANYSFTFSSDEPERLFEIVVDGNVRALPDLVERLTAKYGAPLVEIDEVSTSTGQTLLRTTHEWTGPVLQRRAASGTRSKIRLWDRSSRPDDFRMIMRLQRPIRTDAWR